MHHDSRRNGIPIPVVWLRAVDSDWGHDSTLAGRGRSDDRRGPVRQPVPVPRSPRRALVPRAIRDGARHARTARALHRGHRDCERKGPIAPRSALDLPPGRGGEPVLAVKQPRVSAIFLAGRTSTLGDPLPRATVDARRQGEDTLARGHVADQLGVPVPDEPLRRGVIVGCVELIEIVRDSTSPCAAAGGWSAPGITAASETKRASTRGGLPPKGSGRRSGAGWRSGSLPALGSPEPSCRPRPSAARS
jgi:hypothetical protein